MIGHVDLDLYEGEIVCLLGPSSCGKSTVLKILAGLTIPDGGSVMMLGRPVSEPGPERAVVLQDDAVFPWLTVGQNVEYAPATAGLAAMERRKIADHYLQLTGLEAFTDFFPRQLSGRMKKRVDLARAYSVTS